MNEIFGKNLTYHDIIKIKKINSHKFLGRIYNIDGIVASSFGTGMHDTNSYIKKCIDSIEEKHQKMKNYKIFNKNGLYFFTGMSYGTEYLHDLYHYLDEKMSAFDFYIFNFNNKICLYDAQNKQEYHTENMDLRQLKNQTFMNLQKVSY